MIYTKSPKITGFHGTYTKNIEGILNNNFIESKNHDIWLGDGVYFFVEGIGTLHPSEYAMQFAKDQCWDNTEKKHTQDEYCVLEALIKINDNNFLNLTEEKGTRLFNEFRDMIISKIWENGKRIAQGEYRDSDVLKIMREELKIEFVKSNVYIKFAAQRIGKMYSNIPNVTVLTVNNPPKNIQKSSIKVIKKGEIK